MKITATFAAVVLAAVLATPSTAHAFDATPDVEAGYAAYNRGDCPTALRLLTKEANRHNSDALVGLNYLYGRGHCVPRNAALAEDLARRAASQGNSNGIVSLGAMYWQGMGIARDLKRAVELTCEAIALGNPRAMNNLALMYRNGDYVQRSLAEARFLWRQSAERGQPNAEANLGLSYLNDEDPDPNEARLWLRRAAAHGVSRARAALAQLGEPTPPVSGIDGADEIVIYPRAMPPGIERACGTPAVS